MMVLHRAGVNGVGVLKCGRKCVKKMIGAIALLPVGPLYVYI